MRIKSELLTADTINAQLPTKCICHKGFSGYSSVVVRSNFRVGGQVTAPQSLTEHTLDRWQQSKKGAVLFNVLKSIEINHIITSQHGTI